MTYQQFIEWLADQDADSVLDLLGLETHEILDKFDEKVYDYWREEYADEGDEDSEVS